MSALHSDLLAAAAHLHVLLRRKTGRVTDTEWMASNAEYARAVVDFARERARSDNIPELLPLCARIEELLASARPPRPLARPGLAPGATAHSDPAMPPPRPAQNNRYIGRLR